MKCSINVVVTTVWANELWMEMLNFELLYVNKVNKNLRSGEPVQSCNFLLVLYDFVIFIHNFGINVEHIVGSMNLESVLPVRIRYFH